MYGQIVEKLTSGRFWVTIIVNVAGAVLVIKSIPIPPEFMGIWTLVVYAYFNRKRKEDK